MMQLLQDDALHICLVAFLFDNFLQITLNGVQVVVGAISLRVVKYTS